MLTRKQRWRRVRGGRFVEACSSSPSPNRDDSGSAGRQRRPHPIDSLSIGDSLLHLLGSSTAGEKPSEAAREGDSAATAESSAQKHAVHFNHQVRVVLVPCRTELGELKADIWWGEDDYANFRREYILAVRAKLSGLGDEEESPSSCAEDIAAAAAAVTTATAAEAETKGETNVEVAASVSARKEGDGNDYHNSDNVCPPLKRQDRYFASAPPPMPVLLNPCTVCGPLVEAAADPPTTSATPPAPVFEAPETPTFSCAYSTPDGGAGAPDSVTTTVRDSGSSSADPVVEGGSLEGLSGVGTAAEAGNATNVVVTAISQDALAAAAAAVAAAVGNAAQIVASLDSSDVNKSCSSALSGRCGPDGVKPCLAGPADTVAMVEEAVVVVSEGASVVESARGEEVVEKGDEVEWQTPPRPSTSFSYFPYSPSPSHSISMRDAERFIENSATTDDEEEEGYRTQSTSSVSDHTDAESDSDTDEGENSRLERGEPTVRKNVERPPRLPYRRELPVQTPPAPCLTKVGADRDNIRERRPIL